MLEARDVEEIVERMLARAGRRLDRAQPFVDARLPDGSRLHVAIPPITSHWSVNVRKFVGLFDAVARQQPELFAGAELVPGRLIADTPYEEQVAVIHASIDTEHGRLLARAGLN